MIFLSVNVLKKEIVFSKDSPVINITVAGSDDQQKSKRKPGGVKIAYLLLVSFFFSSVLHYLVRFLSSTISR